MHPKVVEQASEKQKDLIDPINVIENFIYNGDGGIYTPPFATEEEYWGLRSGSEHSVLVSVNGESIASLRFAQCSGALIQNQRTGDIWCLHQSLWSNAAEAAITIQRADDLNVIILDPLRNASQMLSRISKAHNKSPEEARRYLIGESSERRFEEEERLVFGPQFHTQGSILGIGVNDFNDQLARGVDENLAVGNINYLGTIELPVDPRQANIASMLYRPDENLIYMLSHGTNQLYAYPGFSDLK